MSRWWQQGEHVAVIGPTGTGKTTLASQLLDIRDYVCVIAVKRYDDTLNLFKKAHYKIIRSWPPDHVYTHTILWIRPESLDGLAKQSGEIAKALQQLYLSGGWCIYLDEAGYIAGHLGLGHQLGVLLNQGRSSAISVVCSMTRPHSMVARVPIEALNQCRHIIVFKYDDKREVKACADIAGVNLSEMIKLQLSLGEHDFIYIGKGRIMLVRN